MSALAGYKHLIIALEGQSTVIFSKRRKISSIWTDPCVELILQPAVAGRNTCRTEHALLERDMFCGKKKKKTYSTRDSLVVPYQSTDRAQRCLTSQFGWDAVLSPWYDRMTSTLFRKSTPAWKKITEDEKKIYIIISFNFISRGRCIVGLLLGLSHQASVTKW